MTKKADDTHDTSRLDDILGDFQGEIEDFRINEEDLIPWVIELRLIGTSEIIRVPVKEEIILGRSGHQHKAGFDVDLLPYDAQVKGISRKHACLTMRDNRLMIEDLASMNGTYVNGKRLDSYQPVRLHNRDKIRLGRLELQVHFLLQPHEQENTMPYAGAAVKVPRLAKGQRLLILDDNKAICAIVRMIALQAGFLVTVCHDLPAAISHWDTGQIDAIFAEMLLEEGSGLTLITYARQDKSKTVPVIATVSIAGGYQESQARTSGVNELLVKPLAANQIVNALATISRLIPNN